jgi:hypothetical protein
MPEARYLHVLTPFTLDDLDENRHIQFVESGQYYQNLCLSSILSYITQEA